MPPAALCVCASAARSGGAQAALAVHCASTRWPQARQMRRIRAAATYLGPRDRAAAAIRRAALAPRGSSHHAKRTRTADWRRQQQASGAEARATGPGHAAAAGCAATAAPGAPAAQQPHATLNARALGAFVRRSTDRGCRAAAHRPTCRFKEAPSAAAVATAPPMRCHRRKAVRERAGLSNSRTYQGAQRAHLGANSRCAEVASQQRSADALAARRVLVPLHQPH